MLAAHAWGDITVPNQGVVTKFTLKTHEQTNVWVRPPILSFGKLGSSWEMLQGATLTFAGNLINGAITSFAKFVSQEHDRKAAQLGQFVYSNGSVSSTFRNDLILNLPFA